MKKRLLITLPMAGLCSMAMGNPFYLTGSGNLNDLNSWSDTDGTVATAFEGNDFDTNGFTLSTSGWGGDYEFPAKSLTIRPVSGSGIHFQPNFNTMDIPNSLILSENASIRLHNSRTDVTWNIGTLTLGGGNVIRVVGQNNTQNVAANIGVLTGGGILHINSPAGTEAGSHTWNVGDASAFNGTMQVNHAGGLTFTGTGNDFSNATLHLPDLGVISSITIADDVVVGSVTGTAFADVQPGVYDAAGLNTLMNTTIFGGGANLTVIPEPSTYALLFGALFLALAVTQKRRKG